MSHYTHSGEKQQTNKQKTEDKEEKVEEGKVLLTNNINEDMQ
jgi:phosphohistidine swiveling domain-containing protein